MTRMERLAGFAQRHRWTALVAWVVLLVGVTFAGQAIGDDYDNGSDVSLPDTQSQRMADLLESHAPEQTGDSVTVVLHDERGWATDADLTALTDDLLGVDRVEAVVPPDPAQGTVSPDGTLALVQVALEGEQGGAPSDTYEDIVDVATAQETGDLQVELAGRGIRKLEGEGGGASEGAGILAALVILVFMFGSLLAASLPLVTAILAVGTTLGAVTLLSHLITIPDYTSPLLVLVGLGVGIDYALLVFSRYRSELLGGADRAAATRVALDTAGRSVLFAGASVIIALLGMFTLGIAAFEGTVTAVAFTVLVTMVASLTLLPALLSLLGSRLERRILAHVAKRSRRPGDGWRRWAWLVQRAPWPALAVSMVALGALAVPALGIHLGFNDAGNDAAGTTTRSSYDLVSDKLGPGANGPLYVVTEGSRDEAEAAHRLVVEHPGIVADRVSTPTPLADDVFMFRAEPTTGPQEEGTSDLVTGLRDDLGDPHLVGGSTAANVDYAAAISDRFPLFIGVVVGLSALLLMTVFRSVLIAAKAAVLNVLSIGAALGAMKLVYQDGGLWADAGPIEAFMPVFIFAIVFGLSMDYEVFLLSRMREIWLATGDVQHAVREGLAYTGGVITAAAAIMFAVFGAFVLMPDRMLQQTGFAMAVAVLLDAVVVRCLVVPAVMRLLGERAWWLPRFLERLLPRLDVEGRRGSAAEASAMAVTTDSGSR
ncbi:RND superfamily putative drug exporter [Nocardioides thalensis]|uniref:RND superfamily putative drug exporter n=1 Tax=Nocardioides thalensis TaxID=1914755 RepID=A0A853C2E8_9ACTN|nr:MMPL family transporter [Nocardioides thalensis]NYJ00852.1 RND superfamily putative drug exporter [Nocardioides thalensis]